MAGAGGRARRGLDLDLRVWLQVCAHSPALHSLQGNSKNGSINGATKDIKQTKNVGAASCPEVERSVQQGLLAIAATRQRTPRSQWL